MNLEMRELLKKQAYDDCKKYGCPNLGVQHGVAKYGPLAVTKTTLKAPELYQCEFCKCWTNARQRFCCEAGKQADIKENDNG